MKAHLQYLWYIIRHKWFVLQAGLKIGASIWLLLIHDLSKFFPDEFFAYSDYFYNPEKKNYEYMEAFGIYKLAELAPFGFYVKDRFNVAWLLHQRRNKHHWQFWVLQNDDGPQFPLPMPEKYVLEMLADWAGAGRAITGKWGVLDWYEANKGHIIIADETRIFIEGFLKREEPELVISYK